MFVHIGKLNKPLLVVLFAFAIPLGAIYFAECIHRWTASKYPIVEGTVVNREATHRWGIPGGRFSIQLVATNILVFARVSKTALANAPSRVQFHFSGDPTRQVFLEGEDNPLWIVLILWGSPVVLLILYNVLKGKPDFEDLVD
jgi:hypothetical protein